MVVQRSQSRPRAGDQQVKSSKPGVRSCNECYVRHAGARRALPCIRWGFMTAGGHPFQPGQVYSRLCLQSASGRHGRARPAGEVAGEPDDSIERDKCAATVLHGFHFLLLLRAPTDAGLASRTPADLRAEPTAAHPAANEAPAPRHVLDWARHGRAIRSWAVPPYR
jgi:hypothetical protein